jgi:hypothetical protein
MNRTKRLIFEIKDNNDAIRREVILAKYSVLVSDNID